MDYKFRYLGKVDVSEIKQSLSNVSNNLWNLHTIRQDLFDNHRETQTIMLMWDYASLFNSNKGEIHQSYYDFKIDVFLNSIKPLYVESHGEGEFIRVIIVNLPAGKSIPGHADSGMSLEFCNRTHIPIKTNDNVLFTVAGETINMKEGEIWEFNNQKYHSVHNNGDEDRWHLIIDYQKY